MQFIPFAVGFISGVLATIGLIHSLHYYISRRTFQSTEAVKHEKKVLREDTVATSERARAGRVN